MPSSRSIWHVAATWPQARGTRRTTPATGPASERTRCGTVDRARSPRASTQSSRTLRWAPSPILAASRSSVTRPPATRRWRASAAAQTWIESGHIAGNIPTTGSVRPGWDKTRVAAPAVPIPDARDARINAAVAWAPPGIFFDPASLAKVGVPVRIYAAEFDAVVPARYHAEPLRQTMKPTPEFALVRGAGHFSFVEPFPEAVKQLRREIAAFLDRALRLGAREAGVCIDEPTACDP